MMFGQKLPFWRVQIGNLFYMGGLPRLEKDSNCKAPLKLTMEVFAADLLSSKKEAQQVSEILGGVVQFVELSTQEYSDLCRRRDAYIYHNYLSKLG